MASFDYLSAFYGGKYEPQGFVKELDSLLATQDAAVRAIPFGCEKASIDWLHGRCFGDRRVALLSSNNGLSVFQLTYEYTAHGETHRDSGRFFILRHPQYADVFVAITIEPHDFYQRALMPFLGSLYPLIITTFITNKRMRMLLERFQAEGGYTTLKIKRTSLRLRYQTEGVSRKVMPAVTWPEMSLAEAFDWVHQNNGWFQSIQFEVKERERVLATLSFSRQGAVRADHLFHKAYDYLVEPVCKTIHENLALFGHRARLERPDLSALPLAIDFEADQFREVSENHRLIQALQRLKTASVSVLHGNPYVHMSVLDYFDGSAFDLWVLDAKRIVIVPQLKASVAAIKRLINHIFDDYAEGKLINYSELNP